jgi:hypothetical protein
VSFSSVPLTDEEASILEQLASAFEEDRRRRIERFETWRAQFAYVMQVDEFQI